MFNKNLKVGFIVTGFIGYGMARNLIKNSNNSEKMSNIAINFYKSAKENGYSELLVSELIEKKH